MIDIIRASGTEAGLSLKKSHDFQTIKIVSELLMELLFPLALSCVL